MSVTGISNSINNPVFMDNAERFGRVTDIIIDIQTKRIKEIIVEEINQSVFDEYVSSTKIRVPFKYVRSIGDIVILQDLTETEVRLE